MDSVHVKAGNFSREMETIRRSQMEMLLIKTIVTEMRDDFDEVFSRLATVNLKTGQHKLLKLKHKEKKKKKS